MTTLSWDVQCLWMVDSMWTWHSTVLRTRSVRSSPRVLVVSTPVTPTMAIDGQPSGKRLTVSPPTHQQTRGGQSTSEWNCTSGVSISQTEQTAVVRFCFFFHTDSISCTASFDLRCYIYSCSVLTCCRLLPPVSLFVVAPLLLPLLWICPFYVANSPFYFLCRVPQCRQNCLRIRIVGQRTFLVKFFSDLWAA